jgi:hypothetical protein
VLSLSVTKSYKGLKAKRRDVGKDMPVEPGQNILLCALTKLRAAVSGAKKKFEVQAIVFPVSLLQSNHQPAAGER